MEASKCQFISIQINFGEFLGWHIEFSKGSTWSNLQNPIKSILKELLVDPKNCSELLPAMEVMSHDCPRVVWILWVLFQCLSYFEQTLRFKLQVSGIEWIAG